MVIDVVEAHVCPAGQMDVVTIDVDDTVVVEVEVEDGLHVCPVGHIVVVVGIMVLVVVEVVELQVLPVGQIVVVV